MGSEEGGRLDRPGARIEVAGGPAVEGMMRLLVSDMGRRMVASRRSCKALEPGIHSVSDTCISSSLAPASSPEMQWHTWAG